MVCRASNDYAELGNVCATFKPLSPIRMVICYLKMIA